MILIEKKIAEKTLGFLAKKSLSKLSVPEILKNTNSKKINIKSKIDLLKNINRYVDHLIIRETKSIENSTSKDMLFEVLMTRFEILQQNRKSFIEIYKGFKNKPLYFIKLLPSFLESMIITAELSKFNVNGLKGSVRLKGLMFVYFYTFFQWIDDKSSSLEKTMTGLDRNLDQAEKFGKLLK
tara:strand:- start:28 stop:573 length:546 start_codon:yes stop_codon:yes gene_type:complete